MAPRPTTEVADVILDSMDRMMAQLVDRLDGITDEEFLWEPVQGMWSVRRVDGGRPRVEGAGEREADPAPPTTIAWRLWHIAVDCLDDYTRRFHGDSSPASPEWTMRADEAIGHLRSSWERYRTTIESRDMWDQLGKDWEHWSAHAVADMAMHASNELVHHGAEIGLMRDLYRTHGDVAGTRPDRSD